MTVPAGDARVAQALGEMRRHLEGADHREAWRQMCRVMALDSSAGACEAVAAALSGVDARLAGLAELRVAVLTNFTVEPLVPILLAHGAASGLAIRPYVPGFDTWAQEIVDPDSGLRRQQPDVAICYLRLEALAPRLVDEFLSLSAGEVASTLDGVALHVEQALGGLRAWSNARIVVTLFASPSYPALGILDDRASGQTAAVSALNDRVRSIVRQVGNAFVVDADRVRQRVGDASWDDARLWAIARLPHGVAALQALAQEYLRVLRAVAGRARKVLVLDADDTLWGGLVGEVGADGIRLGGAYPGSAFVDVHRAVLEWHRRGVVLAMISKNDEEAVRGVLEQHPASLLRPSHFAALRINWQDKAANMIELADELGLAVDSVVFVDDSSVECDRMRQALPEVLTVPLTGEPAVHAATLRKLSVFDALTFGAEDRARGEAYRIEADRRKLQRELPSLDEFYASLGLTLTIEPVADVSLARAADLTQRTNQFNLNPRRFTAPELQTLLRVPGSEGYLFRLSDRFGDSGIIGFALLEGTDASPVISQFLMSCRVLKRTVEDSVLAFLVERARRGGRLEVTAQAIDTRRNGPARAFVEARGFERSAPGADHVIVYRLPADKSIAFSPFVTIVSADALVPGAAR